VGALMDRKVAFPEAANNRRKVLGIIFEWAMQPKIDLWNVNPARAVKKFTIAGDGYHSWTDDEIEQYRTHHPIGTKARLALEMLLRWSQRRSDVVLFGKQHLRQGWLRFTQFKNRNRKPITLELPVTADMREILDASPLGDLTFLVTDFGKPFTSNGFGNKFREWCDQAKLPHCTSHGLRKAGARQLAEQGKTGHEIKAVTGHRTLKEVDRYTEAARQKTLAQSALGEAETGTKVSSQKQG
jgi:integrase